MRPLLKKEDSEASSSSSQDGIFGLLSARLADLSGQRSTHRQQRRTLETQLGEAMEARVEELHRATLRTARVEIEAERAGTLTLRYVAGRPFGDDQRITVTPITPDVSAGRRGAVRKQSRQERAYRTEITSRRDE